MRHIDVFALKRAARAAVVMPANFAFADLVIGNQDTTLFGSHGRKRMPRRAKSR